MAAEKTFGQVAYEAYEKRFGRDGSDWSDANLELFRDGWEKAAAAAIDTSVAYLKKLIEDSKPARTACSNSIASQIENHDTDGNR